MKSEIKLEASWLNALREEFEKSYMEDLRGFLADEIRQNKTILPHPTLWFHALNSTPLSKVKVVILGQDPYPTPQHPHGLAFSVPQGLTPLPKSLLNINKELLDDLGVDNSHTGHLQPWANQGVLLLNAVLTVEAGNSNAHQGKGWERFTDKIIEVVNQRCDHVVFILWGSYAKKKGTTIDPKRHLILQAPHPSPLSAYRGFFGSKPFGKTNQYLVAHNQTPIEWGL